MFSNQDKFLSNLISLYELGLINLIRSTRDKIDSESNFLEG